MIELFNVMKGLEGLNGKHFVETEGQKAREHELNIRKNGARLDCRRYSFSQMVVNSWNALTAEAVSYSTVYSFKTKIAP